MKAARCSFLLSVFVLASSAPAQVPQIAPRIATKAESAEKVAVVEVATQFVTAIRLPEAVNSVVVGDPTNFQVEHSDREPKLVFVKAVSSTPGATNVLITTISGHEMSLLLVNHGAVSADERPVDFLVTYEGFEDFFVGPSGFPSALVGATIPLSESQGNLDQPNVDTRGGRHESAASVAGRPVSAASDGGGGTQAPSLDRLLDQQASSSLPMLYGDRVEAESPSGNQVLAGVGRVIDDGDRVVVLFSVVNPTKHAILLMPPQVQLSTAVPTGKIIHHNKWATAEQLPVDDFRLNKRRLSPGERADGVVAFLRPPYKQSNETLLLQIAESGAVDRPALAPIGFGVSSGGEVGDEQAKRGD